MFPFLPLALEMLEIYLKLADPWKVCKTFSFCIFMLAAFLSPFCVSAALYFLSLIFFFYVSMNSLR